MKIILVANKYLNRKGLKRLDASYWNFYIPMLELGNEVLFYDTESGSKDGRSFIDVVKDYKPDLIFSILTFNKNFMKFEPIEEIENITKEGLIKTFNWFCDDTWRFKEVSSKECWKFLACSTPEPKYIEEYIKIGYKNIYKGYWHSNESLSHITDYSHKVYDVSFCGHINNQRFRILNNYKITNFYGVSQEDMFLNYSQSKIGINFSLNENDINKKTQMKLRMMEIPSVNTLLLTEYTEGIEELFKVDKEIVTFKEENEMNEKLKFLLRNENIISKISNAGYDKFLSEHTSKKRLTYILENIGKL